MPDPTPPLPAEYTPCSWCGDAGPGGGVPCPTCGHPSAPNAPGLPKPPLSRRGKTLKWLRVLAVVVVVLGVADAIIAAVQTGPPNIPDPLTTEGTYVIGAGNFSAISGNITGEDYIVGNFTVVNPPTDRVTFEVFNSTEYARFVAGENATPADSIAPASASPIVFPAPYTDTFYLTFVNPYPSSTHLELTVYVATQYESNVVIG